LEGEGVPPAALSEKQAFTSIYKKKKGELERVGERRDF